MSWKMYDAKASTATFVIFLSPAIAARLATLARKPHRRASVSNKSLTGATHTNARSCLRYSAALTPVGMTEL